MIQNNIPEITCEILLDAESLPDEDILVTSLANMTKDAQVANQFLNVRKLDDMLKRVIYKYSND